jgi:hypothetical protein
MGNFPFQKLVVVGRAEERDELAAVLAGRREATIAEFIPAGPETGFAIGVDIAPGDILVVSLGLEARPKCSGPIARVRKAGGRVVDFPSYYEKIAHRTPIARVPAAWILDSPGLRRLRSPAVRRAKRIFDILGSLAALIATLPLSLLIAALVKLTSPGPLFFIQERIGHYALRFKAKPGITGWAQVHFPYTASVKDTREKLKFDLYYLRNFTLGLDLRIILRTVRVMFIGLGR